MKQKPLFCNQTLKIAKKMDLHPQDVVDLLDLKTSSSYDTRPECKIVKIDGRTFSVSFFHSGDCAGFIETFSD